MESHPRGRCPQFTISVTPMWKGMKFSRGYKRVYFFAARVRLLGVNASLSTASGVSLAASMTSSILWGTKCLGWKLKKLVSKNFRVFIWGKNLNFIGKLKFEDLRSKINSRDKLTYWRLRTTTFEGVLALIEGLLEEWRWPEKLLSHVSPLGEGENLLTICEMSLSPTSAKRKSGCA